MNKSNQVRKNKQTNKHQWSETCWENVQYRRRRSILVADWKWIRFPFRGVSWSSTTKVWIIGRCTGSIYFKPKKSKASMEGLECVTAVGLSKTGSKTENLIGRRDWYGQDRISFTRFSQSLAVQEASATCHE